jgi:cytochrome P450
MASVLSPEDLEFVERHWDPIDPKVGNPYGLYAELRRRCPVSHSDRHVPGVLSRYQDVWAVARDHATFSNAGGITMPAIGGRTMIPLETDPPCNSPTAASSATSSPPARSPGSSPG